MSTARIEDIMEFVLDGTHGSPVRTEAGIPVLSAQNVKDGKLDFETDRYTSIAEYDDFRRRLPLRAGDVLLTIVGTIGRAAVVDETRPLVFQRSVAVLRPKPDFLWPRFLYHASQSPAFQAQLSRSSNQSSQAGVYLGKLKELRIPLPPLPEQRRIAEILDKADALRVKRRAALAQLDALAQSIFLDMFGDPVVNSKSWNHAEMTDVVVGQYGIKAGPFGSSLRKEDYTTSGYRIYGQEQVIAGRFDIGDYYIGEHKYQQLKSCSVAEGDLLVSLVGSFGKVLIVPPGIEAGIINPRLLKITPNLEIMAPDFLAAFLQHPAVQAELQRVSHGGTMGILNAGLLKRLKVILPPISLQREFARRVASVDKLKALDRAGLVTLDTLFASLQHRAFRVKL